jgi:hypothetical protein
VVSKRKGMDLRWDAIKTSEGVKPSFFAWLARTGLGVRSGSRPIGWVQMHNMKVLDILEARAAEQGVDLSSVSVKKGDVYASGKRLGSVRLFFDKADAACRV